MALKEQLHPSAGLGNASFLFLRRRDEGEMHFLLFSLSVRAAANKDECFLLSRVQASTFSNNTSVFFVSPAAFFYFAPTTE